MKTNFRQKKWAILTLAATFLVLTLAPKTTYGQFPPESSTGSIGLQGTIASLPPTVGASIITPSNGQVFTSVPITISGLCPTNLLVKLFSNNIFVGSVFCAKGSFSIQANLLPGTNDLVARVYDSLDQAGPDSNVVSVTFNDSVVAKFGSRVSLTSSFAELGVNPGSTLTWPIIISQGNGPYAIDVNWGDGSPDSLISQTATGTFNINHIYKNSGIYYIVIKASDTNGTTAYLQVVAVVNGAAIKNNSSKTGNTVIQVKVLWWPAVAMLPLIIAAFWVGRRHELFSLRSKMEKSRNEESKRL